MRKRNAAKRDDLIRKTLSLLGAGFAAGGGAVAAFTNDDEQTQQKYAGLAALLGAVVVTASEFTPYPEENLKSFYASEVHWISGLKNAGTDNDAAKNAFIECPKSR